MLISTLLSQIRLQIFQNSRKSHLDGTQWRNWIVWTLRRFPSWRESYLFLVHREETRSHRIGEQWFLKTFQNSRRFIYKETRSWTLILWSCEVFLSWSALFLKFRRRVLCIHWSSTVVFIFLCYKDLPSFTSLIIDEGMATDLRSLTLTGTKIHSVQYRCS